MFLSEQWFEVTHKINDAFKDRPRGSLKDQLDNEPEEVDCSDYDYQRYHKLMKLTNDLMADMAKAYPDNKKIQADNKELNSGAISYEEWGKELTKKRDFKTIRTLNAQQGNYPVHEREYFDMPE